METERFDLVIIGAGELNHFSINILVDQQAGIHGLTMLKTYRDVHPGASILMLDKGTSIGGVWAKDRLYPGLHTNNHFQTFVLHMHALFAEADGLQI
jgi:hypothetical protein